MEIPAYLVDEIRLGNVALLLGTGASIGAKNAAGQDPPTGKQLAGLIARKFLTSNHYHDPLSVVSELAISESSIVNVQEYIRGVIFDFNPAPFHLVLPTFKWHGIATTNYDLIIERAYEKCPKKVQDLVPFITNTDRIDHILKSPNKIPFVKLHGCITRTTDPGTPLILTIDQYNQYRKNRDRLFAQVGDWGWEHAIVFVGSSLQDPDIRILLQEYGKPEHRQRFFVVTNKISSEEIRFWEGKRITPIVGTFEEFLNTINSSISNAFRGLSVITEPPPMPIFDKFAVSAATLSATCTEFLNNDVEYVRTKMALPTIDPKLFYLGCNGGWASIEQKLDVPRDLHDLVISEAILGDADSSTTCQLFVIKGHAGSGKSVLLRRIAFDATSLFEKLCLFVQPHGRLSIDSIKEISSLIEERIYIFIDKVSDRVAEIAYFLEQAKRSKLPVTLIVAERVNEWNMNCESLNSYVTDDFEVEYLSAKEIDSLLKLLEYNHSLGTLEYSDYEERKKAFEKRAGRQLLVALHEATLGKRFEDIIFEEYSGIIPDSARNIYLGICVLNRFDLSVRAGIISRAFGINFTEFKEKFFKPLEKVVFSPYDSTYRDIVYVARHPLIAEMVFDRVLPTPEDKFDWYMRMLRELNINYDTDRSAYRRILRARVLVQLFPDPKMVETLFRIGFEIAGDDVYLYHQNALYEMHRSNGNLKRCDEYLQVAKKLAPSDLTVIHSMAELELIKADNAKNEIESDAHLKEARQLASRLIGASAYDAYGYHTVAKIGFARLRIMLKRPSDEFVEKDFNDLIKETEKAIQDGLQRFPDAPYLLDAEANICDYLQHEERGVESLKRAFYINPHNTYIAIRLAKYLIKIGQSDEAKAVYEKAIDASPSDKNLHYNYSKLLIDIGFPNSTLVEQHLGRSFTRGDRNYDTRFWYARQLYINNKLEESRALFKELQSYPIDLPTRRKVRGIILEGGEPVNYYGRIVKSEASYCIILRDGTADKIFSYVLNSDKEVWPKLKWNMRVRFQMGFNFNGTNAVSLQLGE